MRDSQFIDHCLYWSSYGGIGMGVKCNECHFCKAEVRSIKEARETYERVRQGRFFWQP